MKTSPIGHKSHTIKGCVLWVADTKARVSGIYISPFLGDTTTWSGQRESVMVAPAGHSLWRAFQLAFSSIRSLLLRPKL